MKKVWPWIIGVIVAVVILAWFFVGRAERQAYWSARQAVHARVDASQDRIDAAVAAATAAVDRALELAGNLPSQQAKADLVKQDIEEIGNRLKEAAEAKGEAALDKVKETIAQIDQAQKTVEEASKEGDPAAKAALFRISSILKDTREKLARFLLTAGQ